MMPKRERFRTTRPVAQLRAGRNDWYRIEANVGSDVASIYVYDEIGYFGVTASDFIAELKTVSASRIDLHLSSPGGEVFDGFAIFEALRAHHASVTTYIDSLAASIASVIAMAGDRIVIGEFAEVMVHDALGVCVGNAQDMREMVEDLERESERIAAVYANRAGGTVRQWRARMQAETWFSAKEAVAAGLADEVAKPERQEEPIAARWDLSVFRYAGRSAAPAPPDAAHVAPRETPDAGDTAPTDQAPDPVPSAPESAAPLSAGEGPAPVPHPEPGPPPLDGDLFRAAMARAAGAFRFDADGFRSAVGALVADAPAVPPPAPVAEPVPEHAPEPAPEPEAGPGEVLAEVVATLAADAPAVPQPRDEVPVPEPPPEPAPEPEPAPDPWVEMAQIFRAGVELASASAPAPRAPAPDPGPEPEPYDPVLVQRALKEAMK